MIYRRVGQAVSQCLEGGRHQPLLLYLNDNNHKLVLVEQVYHFLAFFLTKRQGAPHGDEEGS